MFYGTSEAGKNYKFDVHPCNFHSLRYIYSLYFYAKLWNGNRICHSHGPQYHFTVSLYIVPSIFTWFSRVVTFWKAEGLTNMIKLKNSWRIYGPMRNRQSKVPSLFTPIKKILSHFTQTSHFLSMAFWDLKQNSSKNYFLNEAS